MQSIRAQKAHSLIGQVYDPRNLARAWERVKANKGAGGVDGVTVGRFNEKREYYLGLLHQKLKDGSYRPRPVRRVEIDKPGSTAKRALGIPTVMDRVCQQAVVQVLEPIFEPTFRDESFGFRPGRSTHMAMRRIWRQLKAGDTWVVDADIADFFGTLSHSTLVDLVAERVADGKVLRLLRQFLEAGVLRDGQVEPTLTGVPQGGVASPLLSNVYLHVFDEKMAEAGFALTRYADDWVITCKTRREAERALTSARAVLEGELGLRVHPDKTRIVYVGQGFEFLGYKIKQGERRLRYRQGGTDLYAYPRSERSSASRTGWVHITTRRNPKTLKGCWTSSTRSFGWGNTTRRAHVRRLYHRMNGWIVRRIWSWRYKRWRNTGWRRLPRKRLYGELGLVNLLQLIPSMEAYYRQQSYSR